MTSTYVSSAGVHRAADSSTRSDLARAARQLAVLSLVGAVAGAVVVGVLGRLAMFLLAVLNPLAHGITSDDGFEIGQFTVGGSLNLLAAGVQFGMLAVFGYAATRGLMIGPAWFRLASISLGPAVVVGAILVEPHGVDFTRLDPVELSIPMFIALPALLVAALHLGAERFLPRAASLPRPLVALGLLPWVLLLPLTLLLLGGWACLRALRQRPGGRRLLGHPAPAWILRAGLAVVFVIAVLDLVDDITVLT